MRCCAVRCLLNKVLELWPSFRLKWKFYTCCVMTYFKTDHHWPLIEIILGSPKIQKTFFKPIVSLLLHSQKRNSVIVCKVLLSRAIPPFPWGESVWRGGGGSYWTLGINSESKGLTRHSPSETSTPVIHRWPVCILPSKCKKSEASVLKCCLYCSVKTST